MQLLCRSLAIAGLVVPTGLLAAITPGNVATLAPRWTVTGPGVSGGPTVRGGRVYAGDWGGRVFALDAATGTEIWTRAVGGPVPGRVLVLDDGGVCYGTITPGGGQVGCLDG